MPRSNRPTPADKRKNSRLTISRLGHSDVTLLGYTIPKCIDVFYLRGLFFLAASIAVIVAIYGAEPLYLLGGNFADKISEEIGPSNSIDNFVINLTINFNSVKNLLTYFYKANTKTRFTIIFLMFLTTLASLSGISIVKDAFKKVGKKHGFLHYFLGSTLGSVNSYQIVSVVMNAVLYARGLLDFWQFWMQTSLRSEEIEVINNKVNRLICEAVNKLDQKNERDPSVKDLIRQIQTSSDSDTPGFNTIIKAGGNYYYTQKGEAGSIQQFTDINPSIYKVICLGLLSCLVYSISSSYANAEAVKNFNSPFLTILTSFLAGAFKLFFLVFRNYNGYKTVSRLYQAKEIIPKYQHIPRKVQHTIFALVSVAAFYSLTSSAGVNEDFLPKSLNWGIITNIFWAFTSCQMVNTLDFFNIVVSVCNLLIDLIKQCYYKVQQRSISGESERLLSAEVRPTVYDGSSVDEKSLSDATFTAPEMRAEISENNRVLLGFIHTLTNMSLIERMKLCYGDARQFCCGSSTEITDRTNTSDAFDNLESAISEISLSLGPQAQTPYDLQA